MANEVWLSTDVLLHYVIVENLEVTKEQKRLIVKFPKKIEDDTYNYEYLSFVSVKQWDYKDISDDLHRMDSNLEADSREISIVMYPERNTNNITVYIQGAYNMMNTIIDLLIVEQKRDFYAYE